MSEITKDDVLYVAGLSKIALSDSEAEKFTKELGVILDYGQQLANVDTAGLQPTYQVTGLTNITRKDEELDYGTSQADLLKNSGQTQDGHLKVPRVL